MKKIRISIFAVLLACIFCFAGCTKASNANLEKNYQLYDSITTKYGANEQTGKIIIFNEDQKVELYSLAAYDSTKLYNFIATVDENGSKYVYNTLSINGEYQALVHGVSQLFLQWRQTYYTVDIPQTKVTKMYEALEELRTTSESLSVAKSSFETTFKNINDENSVAVSDSLNEYLKAYYNLIKKFYSVSEAYEAIYETVFPSRQVTKLAEGDIIKLVLSSEIYLAKYYYLKNIELTNNYASRFGFKKIGDTQLNLVDNKNYDSNFQKFIEITQSDSNVGEAIEGDNDKIFYYNAGIEKLAYIKNGVNNFETAVKNVKNNQDKNGEYAKFISDFEIEIQNYQDYLLRRIMV